MNKPSRSKLRSQYLTPLEAASALKVDRRTIYEWARTGKIKAVKFGHTWRIPKRAVEV